MRLKTIKRAANRKAAQRQVCDSSRQGALATELFEDLWACTTRGYGECSAIEALVIIIISHTLLRVPHYHYSILGPKTLLYKAIKAPIVVYP